MLYITLKDNSSEETKNKFVNVSLCLANFKELIEKSELLKKGSYYPRLKNTNKRGIHAYRELLNKYELFGKNKTIMGNIIRLKTLPNILVDELEFSNVNSYEIIFNEVERQEHIISDNPKNMVHLPIDNKLNSNEKIKMILDQIDNLELTQTELCDLISSVSNLLKSII